MIEAPVAQIIHILPEQLASKIAAGEVVQRPASLVKELVENAIDAGATTITVVIKDGGKSFIQVVDDGSGMSEADAVVAFERHATSKIVSYEDLENIRTLGFRGEALASIAAVAQVELRTRQPASAVGTKVRIEGGDIQEATKDSTEPGTIVTVRNLFFNTPGRRNFLRANNTEFKHIFDVVQQAAVSYPEVRFTFVSDGDTVFDLHPESRDERVKDVFGEHQYNALVPVQDSNEFIDIGGYVSKPDFSRKTRVEQYLFLNRRYIVSRNLNHAVFQAFEHLLEKGSFPFFILYLAIDPHHLDVNVHPSKLEVKFEDERNVYRLVMNAVRKALLMHNLVPELAAAGEGRSIAGVVSPGGLRPTWQDLLVNRKTGEIVTGDMPDRFGERREEVSRDSAQSGMSESVQPSHSPPLWQIHDKYVVTPTREGLMIIDQHVAHERVLYERILARIDSGTPTSQQLLFPQTLELTAGDAAMVKQLTVELQSMGFVLKFFGKTTAVIEGIPPDVKPGKETTILQELLDLYKENEHNVKLEPRENLAKSFSCRAAVKAGDVLNEPEMRSLVDQLFSTQNPFVCPHGRPIMVNLSLAELDRRFGRPA